MAENRNSATIFIHRKGPLTMDGAPTMSESEKLSQEFQMLNRSLRSSMSREQASDSVHLRSSSKSREPFRRYRGHDSSWWNESEQRRRNDPLGESASYSRKGFGRKVSWAEDLTVASQTQQIQDPLLDSDLNFQSMDMSQMVEELHVAGQRFAETVHPYVHAYLSLPPGVNPLVPHISGSAGIPYENGIQHAPPASAVGPGAQCIVYGGDLRGWAADWECSEDANPNLIML
jgi:hypothetical protein